MKPEMLYKNVIDMYTSQLSLLVIRNIVALHQYNVIKLMLAETRTDSFSYQILQSRLAFCTLEMEIISVQ